MLAVLPLRSGTSNATLLTLTLMLTSIGVAINWNLTGGFTGYVDFGDAVWFGIGADTTAILMSPQSNGPQVGWPPVPAIVIGTLVAGLLAAAIGRATMRLKGPYFSIAMLGTFVAVREIVRVWGGLTAVDGVDVSVGAGEMVGLIGPNGSGKTTLFDCLSRVSPIDAGSIHFDGTDITGHRPHDVARLGMSRTFQLIRVYRELSVAENMHLSIQWGLLGVQALFARTDAATRRRADELLDFLLLGRLRHERAGNLSGGQRRLLEIGMSLMSEPRLVLLDEATSGVNPTLVADIAISGSGRGSGGARDAVGGSRSRGEEVTR